MTFKTVKPDILKLGLRARENKEFDEVIKLPSDSDTDSVQNFVTLTDVQYNKATLNEASDILSGDGKCSFEVNFYVDTEMANRANVRKVRFSVYTKDPTKRVTTSIDSKPGTRQYFNERFLVAMNKRSKAVGGKGYGKASSNAPNNLIEKSLASRDISNLHQLNSGLIKTFEAALSVTDKSVNEIRKSDRALITEPRIMFDRLTVARALTVTDSSQVYSALVTPKLNINNDALNTSEGQISKNSVTNQTNAVDAKLAAGIASNFQDSEQYLARRALLSEKSDPTAHLNCFYSSGPSSSVGSARNPVQYGDSQLLAKNEVDVSVEGKTVSQGFESVASDTRQNQTTQKSATFSGNPFLQSLYQKSAQISSNAASKSLMASIPIRQLIFKSTLRQHSTKFDLEFDRLRPSQTRELYVMMELIDRDNKVFKSRLINFDFRRQLKGILTPNTPPKIRVLSQKPGSVELELEQLDPLASDMTLYRMVARPDALEEARWVKVTDINANVRRGTIKFVDSDVVSNVLPNLVLYEVSCSGLFGSVCPSTTKIVENGVKRVPNLMRPASIGECTIIAEQKGNKIEIRVSRLPFGVTRIFLRKQHINTATREKDFRSHLTVKTQADGLDFYNVENADSTYVFEDTDVINRQIYRYYVQFDWQDRERTNSISDEYIEYRRLPDRPIISYVENVTAGVDAFGRSTVSFDLGATFSNEGLDELNRLLGETGVSSIFVEELRKDRALVSNLLVYEVSRRNVKTNNILVWPLVKEGKFVDDVDTRLLARAASASDSERDLHPGNDYVYTAKLLIINPERFFKEALTRLPASTQQIIGNTDPNFVKVSAAKFAENFAIQPGTVLSPTTLEKEVDFRTEARGAFTGIEYRTSVSVPLLKAVPRNVSVQRSVVGKAANVIKWDIDGSIESVFSFQVDVVLGRENRVPLRSVSPVISANRSYEIRDELFVKEIAPVSYQVTTIYTDMSKSKPASSNELHAGSTLPAKILDLALKRQLANVVGANLANIQQNTIDSRLLQSQNIDPLVASSLTNAAGSNAITQQTEALRNSTLDQDRMTQMNALNPDRRIRK